MDTERGYDRELMILPFDHRESFQIKMLGLGSKLNPEQTQSISAYKAVIYDGFEKAISGGLPQEKMGILVDEQFSSPLIKRAKKAGYTVCVATEKYEHADFEFAYGSEFASHIEKASPDFVKAQAFINVEDVEERNQAQITKLVELSRYLEKHPQKFILELHVPPTKNQLKQFKEDETLYDVEMKPRLMVQAIEKLQKGGVDPDVWKLEGLERKTDYETVCKACRADNREKVGIIILGRGEDESKVRDWLRAGATVAGVIGFSIGRTIFWEPLKHLLEKKITRNQAVDGIAANYTKFCRLWMEARTY